MSAPCAQCSLVACCGAHPVSEEHTEVWAANLLNPGLAKAVLQLGRPGDETFFHAFLCSFVRSVFVASGIFKQRPDLVSNITQILRPYAAHVQHKELFWELEGDVLMCGLFCKQYSALSIMPLTLKPLHPHTLNTAHSSGLLSCEM
jgi:hypothetical protein